jgi:hypothetical protein
MAAARYMRGRLITSYPSARAWRYLDRGVPDLSSDDPRDSVNLRIRQVVK